MQLLQWFNAHVNLSCSHCVTHFLAFQFFIMDVKSQFSPRLAIVCVNVWACILVLFPWNRSPLTWKPSRALAEIKQSVKNPLIKDINQYLEKTYMICEDYARRECQNSASKQLILGMIFLGKIICKYKHRI